MKYLIKPGLIALILLLSGGSVMAQGRVYLPLISSGEQTVTAAARIEGHGLPACTEAMYAEMRAGRPEPPDNGQDASRFRCRANIVATAPSTLPAQAFFPNEVAPAAAEYETWRFAYNYWSCTAASCPTGGNLGITHMYSVVSSNRVYAVATGGWNNYLYTNKIVVGDPNSSISCPQLGVTMPVLGVGLGQGNISGIAWNPPRLIIYSYVQGYCAVLVTDTQWYTNGNGALVHLGRCGTGTQWKAEIWYNNAWVVLRACAVEGFTQVRYYNQGIGLWAADGNWGPIRFSPNYVHKTQLYYLDGNRAPWYEGSIPTWARGKSFDSYAGEMIVMDASGSDRTAMAVMKP